MKGHSAACGIAFWLIVLLAVIVVPQGMSAASIIDADNYLTAENYARAEATYRSLIADDKTGDAYAGLAVALAKQATPQKILESEQILRRAKDKFVQNPNVTAAAAFVSLIHAQVIASPAKKDEYLEAAEKLCNMALNADPDILIAQQTLGQVLLAQDEPEEAIIPLRHAVDLAENPFDLSLLAQVLLKVNPKDPEASDVVDRALQLNRNYYPARLQHAVVLAQQGKNEDAFMELSSIPQSARGYEWHQVEGDVYYKEGDGPAALASWQEASRLEPHSPQPYKAIAEYYAMRGDGELAIAELHNALEILPNDTPLRMKLAELALRQDKLDVAETEYKTILASDPDDPNSLLGLSRVYYRKARRDGQYPPGWQELMDQLQNVVTEKSVQGKILKSGTQELKENIELSEAEKSLSQNQFREAREHFLTVINNHRDDPYALLTLGEQALNEGDLLSAEEAFNYAKEIPAVASRAEQGLAKLLVQRNEAERQVKLGDATRSIPEVAIDHYKQALIADPECAKAYYGLYTIFAERRRQEPQKALDYAICFLQAADENNPMRKSVEAEASKLKQRLGHQPSKRGKEKEVVNKEIR
jgi:tetratricopeptide (TPR) repeat protein